MNKKYTGALLLILSTLLCGAGKSADYAFLNTYGLPWLLFLLGACWIFSDSDQTTKEDLLSLTDP